jgi:hypothetical protein
LNHIRKLANYVFGSKRVIAQVTFAISKRSITIIHSYITPHVRHWWEQELWNWACKSNTDLSNNVYNTCNQFLAIILLNFLQIFSRSNVRDLTIGVIMIILSHASPNCFQYKLISVINIQLRVQRSPNEKREWDDSPESLITPYEDINTKQQKITGERFRNIVLELCDSWRWLLVVRKDL